jgi:hypothetical protein
MIETKALHKALVQVDGCLNLEGSPQASRRWLV